METKICSKCKIKQKFIQFDVDKSRKDGLKYNCKTCTKQQRFQNKNKLQIYFKKNKEKIYALNNKYQINNKEKLIQQRKEYYLKNKEKINKYSKNYIQTEKGKAIHKALNKKRKALKMFAIGNFTGQQILELFNKQKGICIYCKCKLYKTGNNKYHIDHIMPLSKGGNNYIENIQLLCPKCNLSKNAKYPEDFAQQFGMLI